MSGPRRSLGGIAGAVLVGGVLAAAPFLRYGPWGGHGPAHDNHEARHGGQLGMTGDFHVELVARGERAEVFVSDAFRRPLRPEAGWVAFDRGPAVALAWEGYRLVGGDPRGAGAASTIVVLEDGTRLEMGFDLR